MGQARKRKRYGRLIGTQELYEQLVKEKGYHEADVRCFMTDLEDILVNDLAGGNSVHLFSGLYVEVVERAATRGWNFKEQRVVDVPPLPTLFFRVTDKLRDKIFENETIEYE